MKRFNMFTLVLAALAVLIISVACSKATASDTPTATQTIVPIVNEIDPYEGVTTSCGQGISYQFTGAGDDSEGRCLDNDIVRFTLDENRFVQGYIRAATSLYEGGMWTAMVDFDGVDGELGKLFDMDCTGFDPFVATVNTDVVGQCGNEANGITVTVRVSVQVLSTTDVVPAAPLAYPIEWSNMQEGESYLFCVNDLNGWFQYRPEGGQDATEYNDCAPGKLINKLAYRILWISTSFPYNPEVVTLFPDNVAGGYAFMEAKDLIMGRPYYICRDIEGDPLTYINELPLESPNVTPQSPGTIEICSEAVYVDTVDTYARFFNSGGDVYIKDLPGAYPSPRP